MPDLGQQRFVQVLPACLPPPRFYYYSCGASASASTHLLHAVFPLSRQPARAASLPHGSPATSSRQRRSNHPQREMMVMIRKDWGGIIHATCCWYTTEEPPNPLPLCWSVHAPGRASSAGRCFVSGIPPDGAVCGLPMGPVPLLLLPLLLYNGWSRLGPHSTHSISATQCSQTR